MQKKYRFQWNPLNQNSLMKIAISVEQKIRFDIQKRIHQYFLQTPSKSTLICKLCFLCLSSNNINFNILKEHLQLAHSFDNFSQFKPANNKSEEDSLKLIEYVYIEFGEKYLRCKFCKLVQNREDTNKLLDHLKSSHLQQYQEIKRNYDKKISVSKFWSRSQNLRQKIQQYLQNVPQGTSMSRAKYQLLKNFQLQYQQAICVLKFLQWPSIQIRKDLRALKQGGYIYYTSEMKQNLECWGDIIQIYIQPNVKKEQKSQKYSAYLMGIDGAGFPICLGLILDHQQSSLTSTVFQYLQNLKVPPLKIRFLIPQRLCIDKNSIQEISSNIWNCKYYITKKNEKCSEVVWECCLQNFFDLQNLVTLSGVQFVNEISLKSNNLSIIYKLRQMQAKMKELYSQQMRKIPEFHVQLIKKLANDENIIDSRSMQDWHLVMSDLEILRLSFLLGNWIFQVLFDQYKNSVFKNRFQQHSLIEATVVETQLQFSQTLQNNSKDRTYFLSYKMEQDHWECNCNYIYAVGLPCSHLIKVIKLYGGSLQYYINSRWILKKTNDQISSDIWYLMRWKQFVFSEQLNDSQEK